MVRISGEELLKDIRNSSANTEITSTRRFFADVAEYSGGPSRDRFGGRWRAFVRAGRKPPTGVPISEEDYDTYIQTAINASYPSVSLFGLLRAFTGIPTKVLREFNTDWVSRLDSDLQATLITVPAEYIAVDDDWVLIAPTHYTISGEEKPTGLEPLLRWIDDTGTLTTTEAKGGILQRLITEAGLDIDDRRKPPALRASAAAHLSRQGASPGEIEMQIGAEKTGWRRSVEDYMLYLYQFEDYCHPSYEPSGTYLDQESGDVRKIESKGD
jgi:hypothetical protein